LCRRRNDGGSLSDLGIGDDYDWEGMADDRIDEYWEAKETIIEKVLADVQSGAAGSQNPGQAAEWVKLLSADQMGKLKLLLLRRAIALVHVLIPIEEERQGIRKLHQKGFVSPQRWESYELAEKLCADELRSVTAEAQELGLSEQFNIIPQAVSLYRRHGKEWPNGPDPSALEPPEHPCPEEFPHGCRVKWAGADDDIPAGAIGQVASGVANEPGQVKVKFPNGNFILKVGELQKVEAPIESTETAPKPFENGQKVRWMSHDDDIVEGEVGDVVGGRTNGQVRVKFAKGTWSFSGKELLNPDGSPCIKQPEAKPHPDAKEPPKSVIKVHLTKEAGESLGFDLDTSLENCLLIKSISAGSAQKYNEKQDGPSQQIRVGDRIAAVVDCSLPAEQQKPIAGDSAKMLEVIQREECSSFFFIMERILGPNLRYKLGSRVKANCGDRGWVNGTVVDVWAKGKPYVISLENPDSSSSIVVAPADADNCVLKGDPRFKVGDEVVARRESGYERGAILEVIDNKLTTGYLIKVASDGAEIVAPEDRNRFLCPVARFVKGDAVLAKVGDTEADGYTGGVIEAVYNPEWMYAIVLTNGSVVTAPQDTDYYVKRVEE